MYQGVAWKDTCTCANFIRPAEKRLPSDPVQLLLSAFSQDAVPTEISLPQSNSPEQFTKTVPRSNSKEHSKEKFPKEQFHRAIPTNSSKEQSQIGQCSLP